VTGQNAHGDRKIKGRALLFDIRRGKADRNLVGRDVETAIFKGGTDPFPGFLDAGIRETYQDKLRQAVTDVYFDVYGKGVNA